MDIVEITDRTGLERAFPVVKELRTHLDFDEFATIFDSARTSDHFRLVAIQRGDRVLAVMGFRILHDFMHGKHLYVDDLVTTKDHRSEGHGAKLLKFAEAEAQRLGCSGLRLCTGLENEAGRRFYEREGWHARAVAFTKRLPRA